MQVSLRVLEVTIGHSNEVTKLSGEVTNLRTQLDTELARKIDAQRAYSDFPISCSTFFQN